MADASQLIHCHYFRLDPADGRSRSMGICECGEMRWHENYPPEWDTALKQARKLIASTERMLIARAVMPGQQRHSWRGRV